jgi:predicted transcriptional regulator
MTDNTDKTLTAQLVADIVASYVTNNQVAVDALPTLISTVSTSVNGLFNPAPVVAEAPARPEPAVSIRKSITPEFLICLEDGKKLKSMKRHLSILGLTPDQYRAKWGLPKDYPMVAPAYAAQRSELARTMGLGRGGRGSVAAAVKTAKAPKAAKVAATA